MHYDDLIKAHDEFYDGEFRAEYYDRYLRNKNWALWQISVPLFEVEKLFKFIRSWDRFFQGNEVKFLGIYEEIAPFIKKIENLRIENIDLDNSKLKKNITIVFNKVADCTLINRYESTDASKILHTIAPYFFVMWDREIRKRTLAS